MSLPVHGLRSMQDRSGLEGRWIGLLIVGGVLLILLVTLFPYEFFLDRKSVEQFALISCGHGCLGDFLGNVLLFLPLGFGLACGEARRIQGHARALNFVLVISAGLSLVVEFFQVYLPSREPSLLDVLANTTGGVLGWMIFRLCGSELLEAASALGRRVVTLVTVRVLVAALVGYAVLGILISLPLARATRLSNWDRSYPLLLGNEKSGDRPWQGQVFRVEMTSRAISEAEARIVSERDLPEWTDDGFLFSYQFKEEGYRDATRNFPALRWRGKIPEEHGSASPRTGDSWLETEQPVGVLVEKVQETNQFTLHVSCAPANTTQRGPARIVSVSADPYHRNFTLGQEGRNLVFRLRTPLTGKNGMEPELVVPGVFATSQRRDLIVRYDGQRVHLYVDGIPHSSSLDLSPGAALFSHFRKLDAHEMRGYRLAYYALIFLPYGVLLGMLGRKHGQGAVWMLSLLAGSFLLVPLVLEMFLTIVGKRIWSPDHFVKGIVFSLFGLLLPLGIPATGLLRKLASFLPKRGLHSRNSIHP